MTIKDLRRKIENKTININDIKKAIDQVNALAYDNKLTIAVDAAYNTYLCKAAKAINLSIKELNDLAMKNYVPQRYR